MGDLQFQPPPPWLIQEYVNRKQPAEIASEGIGNALQGYAAIKQQQNANQLAQQKAGVDAQELAMKQRAQFYNYGDIASLPKDQQAQIGQLVQGPVDESGAGPAKSPIISHFEQFLSQNPQGIKGQTMVEDNLFIKDPETGALVPSGTSQRSIKGKTIVSSPGNGPADQKRTFQLKGFEGNVPVSYDTRTGELVRGQPTTVPLSPAVAPSIPGTEVNKFGDLDNLKKKMAVLRQNYKPEFVGMVDAPMQALKQKTGLGATKEAAFFKQTTQDIKDSLLRARSGAQINEQEYQRLLPLVPNETMSEVDFLAKADRFDQVLNEMLSSKQGAFQKAGYRTPDFSSGQAGGLDPAKKSRLEELRAKRAAGTLR